MSCTPSLTRTLRARGFRMTPQRLAILQVLHDGGHLSPAQVYDSVRESGVTEATVYRTLELLADNGLVLVADRGNGHLAYELTVETHHHVVCRGCGAQLDVEPELLQDIFDRLEQSTGYRLNTAHLTFSGLCSHCRSNIGSKGG
jgi:Fur family ferric uptake transcriptional regulator